MRILVVNPAGTLGGAERVLLGLFAGLPQHTFALRTLSDGPFLEAARAFGVDAEALPLPARFASSGESDLRDAGKFTKLLRLGSTALFGAPGMYRYLRQARRNLAAFAPDIVHASGIKSQMLTRLIAPQSAKLLWHIHDFYGLRPMTRKLAPRLLKSVSAAVAISDAVRHDTQTLLPTLPTTTIRNAVDIQHFAPGPAADLDALAGLTPDNLLRIGIVATYARWKGQETFLEAAAMIKNLPARFYIIGGPIYRTAAQFSREELHALAVKFGIADRVGFVPFQADTAPIYRALDGVVHASSLPEPFGLTIAEAMACGRPTIVSQAGGAAELFTHNVDALGFPPGDAVKLAEAMRTLLTDADTRHRLGSAARQTAERDFRPELFAERFAALYDSLRTS